VARSGTEFPRLQRIPNLQLPYTGRDECSDTPPQSQIGGKWSPRFWSPRFRSPSSSGMVSCSPVHEDWAPTRTSRRSHANTYWPPAELQEIVSKPCESEDSIDDALREYLSFSTQYKGDTSPSPYHAAIVPCRDGLRKNKRLTRWRIGSDEFLSADYDISRCSYNSSCRVSLPLTRIMSGGRLSTVSCRYDGLENCLRIELILVTGRRSEHPPSDCVVSSLRRSA
jgi:hypothetical protein